MNRLKRFKRIRLHHEGVHTLVISFLLLAAIDILLYCLFSTKVPFYCVTVITLVVYGIMVNFFRCPIRVFGKNSFSAFVGSKQPNGSSSSSRLLSLAKATIKEASINCPVDSLLTFLFSNSATENSLRACSNKSFTGEAPFIFEDIISRCSFSEKCCINPHCAGTYQP